jgi:integrase
MQAKNATQTPALAHTLAEKRKPILIKRGSVSVKIRPGINRVDGKEYPQFTLIYFAGNKRVRERFSDLESAKKQAQLVLVKLANGENEVLKLTAADRAIYVQALDLLKPLNTPLNVAVADYISAIKKLPSDITLSMAANDYQKHHSSEMSHRTVRQVVDEMVEVKTKAGRSAVHVEDIKSRLGKFADAFQMDIGQVTQAKIQAFIDSLDVSGRTKLNYLQHITSLFRFAIRRKYLPKDAVDELLGIERPEAEDNEIEIFSPQELEILMTAARPEMLPWLAIGAFAGLRHAELQRLDWSEVKMDQRCIEVPATKAKTASRRLAPMPDNLFAWLQPHADKTGRVTPFENMAKQIDWLVKDANVLLQQRAEETGQPVGKQSPIRWKRNGLRHSFVSYRLAAIKDAAQVALEAGNSPAMVFKHYRQLVTEKEAARWSGIVPTSKENVINIPAREIA